ncbi:hypothetical protein L7F22_003787 [Adiantum nelumboides]|nr:hypothetical protein [Adiantum nelumboides]
MQSLWNKKSVFCSISFALLLCLSEACLDGRMLSERAFAASVTDFGAVGDGVTLNTQAFQAAIAYLQQFSTLGGSQLTVPQGTWLTGSFNLTSNFTLYLHKDAVILASQNMSDWPIIDPLPSYGRGRERPGGRHVSLIHGENLNDVIITGDNGTIDGQGSIWWDMWYNHVLEHTRGHLIEFINTHKIIIFNVVLRDSPFWNIHPVYCDQVIVKDVSIFAPSSSPNTDGIDPDSSTNVCIEDCYISNGDDLVALKSGWDEYGIAYGRPSANIVIRRVTGSTPFSGIAIGSEMSGGIRDVFIEDVHLFNMGTGIRIKTAPGRGGYVSNITITGVTMENVQKAIDVTTNAGEHPDGNFNPTAFPQIKGVVIDNVVGHNVSFPGRFLGLQESPLLDICLSKILLNLSSLNTWSCTHVEGSACSVYPAICSELQSSQGQLCIQTTN